MNERKKRHIKKFASKSERDAALLAGTLCYDSVTVFGNKKIEYGVGNGPHTINLGTIDDGYDAEEHGFDSSSDNF